jgi:hypothetical protein
LKWSAVEADPDKLLPFINKKVSGFLCFYARATFIAPTDHVFMKSTGRSLPPSMLMHVSENLTYAHQSGRTIRGQAFHGEHGGGT